MKTIPGFPDYAITKDGRVWSKPRKNTNKKRVGGYWLRAGKTKYGHSLVVLRKNNHSTSKLVHSLILETYIGPCPEGMECRHLDGNPQNNCLSNLRWGTHKENMNDRDKHGTTPHTHGEIHGKTPFKESDVRMIVYMYRTGLFSQVEIARIYGVTGQSISAIVNKKSWRHLWLYGRQI